MKQKFHSNGKLLLTGEYIVLEGATALALPSNFGQSLDVETNDEPIIDWICYDNRGKLWFQEKFSIEKGEIFPMLLKFPSVSGKLIQIFRNVLKLRPDFLRPGMGYTATSTLEFPNNWGLGSSSTLINNIAQWTNTDPFILLQNSFGGSGYDVAAARMNSPFLYTLKESPQIQKIKLPWEFKDKLYFIHLNVKQNSREAIDHFHSVRGDSSGIISKINAITSAISTCQSLNVFKDLSDQHEKIISELLRRAPVKEVLFKDYPGSVKSLGAWGGDFVLVTAELEQLDYFRTKGYKTIIPFKDMVK